MQDYSLEVLALRRILGQGKTYRETIFRILSAERVSTSSVLELKRTVFGVLRRYFSLSHDVEKNFPSYGRDSDERYLLLLTLFLLRQKKEREEVKENFLRTFSGLRLVGDPSFLFDRLSELGKTAFFLPEELKASPYAYNALALEIPEFLLHDLVFSYGAEKAKGIALSLREMPSAVYVRNVFSSADGSLPGRIYALKRGHAFLLPKDCNTRKIPEIVKRTFYPVDLIKLLAIDQLSIDGLSFQALLLNQRTPFLAAYLDGIYQDLPQISVTPVFVKEQRYRSSIEWLKEIGSKNVKPLLSSLELAKTYFPEESMDFVALQGDDVFLGKAGMRPDVLPDLTKKDMQESFSRQTNQLLQASPFVKKGGFLLFLNAGITMEETRNVRESFLSLRKNFELVADHVLLPIDEGTEGGYFALFRRVS